jgi:predicted esterase
MKTAVWFLLVAATVASAEAPRAKSVEKKGGFDVVTLESGTRASVYVPKGEAKGLVMGFHGNYSDPAGLLTWAKPVADHRGEIWVALEATGQEEGLLVWDLDKDVPRAPELLEYALATYKTGAKRVAAFGFSMGGAAALRVYGASRASYTGVVQCAATEAPGERGDAAKGGRGVFILGTRDGNYAALGQWRPAIARAGDGFATWIVTDLDHELPDPVYAHDALAFLTGGTKGGEKTLPKVPDHEMAASSEREAREREETALPDLNAARIELCIRLTSEDGVSVRRFVSGRETSDAAAFEAALVAGSDRGHGHLQEARLPPGGARATTAEEVTRSPAVLRGRPGPGFTVRLRPTGSCGARVTGRDCVGDGVVIVEQVPQGQPGTLRSVPSRGGGWDRFA